MHKALKQHMHPSVFFDPYTIFFSIKSHSYNTDTFIQYSFESPAI